ncbi:hypothetical protein ACWGEA_38745 [Streptomyces zaomyceticus]
MPFRFAYEFAVAMNFWNSCVVLDMPIEISTTLPFTRSTCPEALRGSTWFCARATPAFVCAVGRTLLPPG